MNWIWNIYHDQSDFNCSLSLFMSFLRLWSSSSVTLCSGIEVAYFWNKLKFTFSTKVFNCICLSSCFLLRSNYLCSWRRFFLYSESSYVFWLALSSFNSLSNLSFSSLYSACESKVLTEWRIKGGNSPSNDFCYFFYGCFY